MQAMMHTCVGAALMCKERHERAGKPSVRVVSGVRWGGCAGQPQREPTSRGASAARCHASPAAEPNNDAHLQTLNQMLWP